MENTRDLYTVYLREGPDASGQYWGRECGDPMPREGALLAAAEWRKAWPGRRYYVRKVYTAPVADSAPEASPVCTCGHPHADHMWGGEHGEVLEFGCFNVDWTKLVGDENIHCVCLHFDEARAS